MTVQTSWAWPLALPLGLAALLLTMACTNDGGDGEDLPVDLMEVEVGPAGIDPREVEVLLDARYQLVVHNESDQECSFDLGPYVRDLVVDPGETGEIDFTVPPEEPEGDVTMGCDGSEEHTGEVVIRAVTAPDAAD